MSAGILVVGTAVAGDLTFEGLGSVLAETLGGWATSLFALGLFAAGFSSSVTAPLAAALTVKGLLADPDDPAWGPRSVRYRATWGSVLAVGIAFGLSGVRPIPVILLAQALNGLLLPLVALFLFLAVNDRRRLGEAVNGPFANGVTALVVAVTVLLGLVQLSRAASSALGQGAISGESLVLGSAVIAAAAAWPVGRAVAARRRRAGDSD